MKPMRDDEDHYGPEDQKHLRLVECAACEAKERALFAIGVDLENLEADLKAKNRVIGKLKSELAQERREAPFHAEAQVIYEFWKKHLKPGARMFGEDRLKVVLARLNDKERVEGKRGKQFSYPPRYICEAILGAKYKGKAYDLKWICGGTSNLEYCHGLYVEHTEAQS